MYAVPLGARIFGHTLPGRVSTPGMRYFALGAISALAVGCSDGGGMGRRLPPETAIDDKPAALTNQSHVRITFHALGLADHFTCQLDAGVPVLCASPFEADV